MRLVLAALTRPITVVVALIAIALCAALAIQRMPVDIFPQVGDPAIYVAQPYSGMDPEQIEGHLTYYFEYHFLYITGIDYVESKSIQGDVCMAWCTDTEYGHLGNHRLRESRPLVHAARHRPALYHAI
jgi:multidrug efflux pump subunit AcrB